MRRRPSGDDPRSLVRAVPVWAWLTGIVAVSALVRYVLGRGTSAPWIMVDELIYSELAKSFAATGHFLVRDQRDGGVRLRLSGADRAGLGAVRLRAARLRGAKAINSLVMSLAAVPAYFLARRVLTPGLRARRGRAHGGDPVDGLHRRR